MNEQEKIKKRKMSESASKETKAKKTPAKKTATKKTAPSKSKSTNTKSTNTKSTNNKKTTNKDEVKKSTSTVTPSKKATKTTKTNNNSKTKKTKKEILLEQSIVEEKKERLEKTLIFDGLEKDNLQEVIETRESENVIIDNKVIKRSKLKHNLIVFLSILIVLIIIGATTYTIYNICDSNKKTKTIETNIYESVKKRKSNTETNDEDKLQEETKPSKTAYDHIEEITLSSFEIKVLNGENLNIMIFSSTCYACATFEPIIEEVLENQDKIIYKIDITKLSSEEIDTLRSYYSFTKTPTIFTIRDGIVSNELIGSVTESDFETWAEEYL